MAKVGDYLKITAEDLDAPSYTQIVRETHERWVCSNGIQVLKDRKSRRGGLMVFGHHSLYNAQAVAGGSGVGISIAFELANSKDAEYASIIADLFEVRGFAEQAARLRETVKAFEKLTTEPLDAPELKPVWRTRREYWHGRPEEYRRSFTLVLGTEEIAHIDPTNLVARGQGWRWDVVTAKPSKITGQTFGTLKLAKRTVLDWYNTEREKSKLAHETDGAGEV